MWNRCRLLVPDVWPDGATMTHAKGRPCERPLLLCDVWGTYFTAGRRFGAIQTNDGDLLGYCWIEAIG